VTNRLHRILPISFSLVSLAFLLAACDGPPPPMIMSSGEIPSTADSDVVPVVGDLGGPVDISMDPNPFYRPPGMPAPANADQPAPPASSPKPVQTAQAATPALGQVPTFAAGIEVVSEFPTVRATTTGSISGSGSVTNSTPRMSIGVDAIWTSPQFRSLLFPFTVGGSLYVGLPIGGDSIASGRTTGGFTERLQISNNAPILLPSLFMDIPVGPGANVGFDTGIWIENTKETVSLSNSTFSESDTHDAALLRPFLGGSLVLHLDELIHGTPILQGKDLKFSGGYIFPTVSTVQADFCPGGFSCIRTQEEGSFFVSAAFNVSFPAPGAPPPPP
jgi:hypothetical protein